eukprot:Nk52_evm18s2579 gene=Nk52_evmTU18s2579
MQAGEHDEQDWHKVRAWLLDVGLLCGADYVFESSSTIVEFALFLKDGTLLNNLLNFLDSSVCSIVHPNPKIQFQMFENINSFLDACSRHFGLLKSDLFKVDDLFYASDFGKVIHTINKLSTTPQAVSRGLRPVLGRNRSVRKDDDIYGNLENIMDQRYDDVYQGGAYSSGNYSSHSVTYGGSEYGNVIYGNEYSKLETISRPESPIIGDDEVEDHYADVRLHVVKELIDTERNYIRCVDMIIKSFKQPMTTNVQLIPPEHIVAIFSNIEELLAVNRDFLRQLEDRVNNYDGDGIYMCFLNMKEFFKKYGEYCSNQPYALDTVAAYQYNSKIRSYLSHLQEKSKQQFFLSDLIMAPMQRILKYPLLIKELLRYTPKFHSDHEGLTQAMEGMKGVAKYINDMKKERDLQYELGELQKKLQEYYGPDLCRFGKLNRDGDLSVAPNGSTLSYRYVFLFDRILVVCKLKSGKYVYKNLYCLKDSKLEDLPTVDGKKANGFRITCGDSHCTFVAKTPETKNKWMKALMVCIEENADTTLSCLEFSHDFRFKNKYYGQCYHCATSIGSYDAFQCHECAVTCHRKCQYFLAQNCEQIMENKAKNPSHKKRGIRGLLSFKSISSQNRNSNSDSSILSSSGELDSKIESLRDQLSRKSDERWNKYFDYQERMKECERTYRQGLPEEEKRHFVRDITELDVAIAEIRGSIVQALKILCFNPFSSGNGSSSSEPRPKAIAKYNFTAMISGELTIKVGDEITLLDQSDEMLWKGSVNGNTGFFPPSTVDLAVPGTGGTEPILVSPSAYFDNSQKWVERQCWFHGRISRLQSIIELDMTREPSFLMRQSDAGHYTLSVAYNNKIKHIKINKGQQGYFLSKFHSFQSLQELMDYYRVNSLAGEFSGLCMKLETPVRTYLLIRVQTMGYSAYCQATQLRRTRSVKAYEAKGPLEISFAVNADIIVLDECVDGYVRGIVGSHSGLFPEGYIEFAGGSKY